MPILPLDHPEPFAATLGVMLYPGTEEEDQRKARAFAAGWLAKPLRDFHEAAHQLPYDDLLRIATDGGTTLIDLQDRWWGGSATGEMFKALFALATNNPEIASWENAVKLFELCSGREGSRGSRTSLWQAKSRF